jgi:hypothetical protein
MLYSNLPPAVYAGCTSILAPSNSTIVSVRASQTGEGTMVVGPMTMWAQPITVLLQSSDSSLFVSSTSSSSTSISSTPSPTSISTIIPVSTTSPTPTSQPSPMLSTDVSVGAKAGIGIGVGIGVLVIFSMVGWWLHRRKTRSIPTATGPPYYYSYDNAPSKAGSGISYGPPIEMENSAKPTNLISELQG